MANLVHKKAVERIREEGAAFLSSIALVGEGEPPHPSAAAFDTDTNDEDEEHGRPQSRGRGPEQGSAGTASELLTADAPALPSSGRRRRRLTSGDMGFLRDVVLTGQAQQQQQQQQQGQSAMQPSRSPRLSRAQPSLTFVSDVQANTDMLVNTRVLVTSPRGGMPLATFSLIPATQKKRRRFEKSGQRRQDKFAVKPIRKTRGFGRQLREQPEVHDHTTLDDPFLHHGRHQKMLSLKSYTVSISHYVTPQELKESLNASFKERFPDIQLTLSKLRSLKRDMVEIGCEMCNMEVSTVAYAHYYFEHLVLKRWVTKPTRKLIPACCLLLAFKFNSTARPSVVKQRLKPLFKAFEDKWRLSQRDILLMEMRVFAELSFALFVPPAVVASFTSRIRLKHPSLAE